jgi:hypothetical protein
LKLNFSGVEKEDLAKGGRNKEEEVEKKIIIIKQPVLCCVVTSQCITPTDARLSL